MTINKLCFPTGLLAAMLFAGSVRADLIISAPKLTVMPGSSGQFDILLSHTGPGFEFIGAFSFDISTSNPGISFTDASTSTPAYIYAGDSFAEINGLPLATKTGQELIASDTPNDGMAPAFAPDTIVSLGEVSYSIARSVPSGTTVAITFSGLPGTSLSDEFGNPLAFSTQNGEIIAVPEPAFLSSAAACLALLALWRMRRAA